MSSRVVLAFLFVLVSALGVVPASTASAETFSFQIQSNHPNIVDVELYSTSRRGHVWPGNGNVYVFNDYDVKSIRISCIRGEQICYGAWVRNQSNTYWGVGYKNRNSCRNCCYVCNGGSTRVIVLNP